MYDLIRRENEIIEILRRFSENNLEFTVVGGYAVSAFRHRFSIDADIVIRGKDSGKFRKILLSSGYFKTTSFKTKDTYSSEFVRYENKELKVNVDLLINGLVVRQTKAAFGVDFLFEHAEKRLVEGIDKAVEVNVPKREILIILKLHSGRLTDLRDVAALSYNLDFNIIKKHMMRGERPILIEHIEKLNELIEKPEFQDSFKGVFMEKEYLIDMAEIRKLTNFRGMFK